MFVVRRWSFVVRRSLSVVRFVLLVRCWLLVAVRCLLFFVCKFVLALFVVCWLLSGGWLCVVCVLIV